MRYYDIKIFDAPANAQSQPVLYREFKSQTQDGNFLPGALNIELDLPIVDVNSPTGDAYVRVWGISIKDINESSNFNNKIIEVYGGMQKGLPLANPKQKGLLVRGTIFQAWGNWQGTEMSIDFIIKAGIGNSPISAGSPLDPVPMTFSCKAGGDIGEAIAITLDNAYKANANTSAAFNINVSPKLIAQRDYDHYCQSLSELSIMLNGISKSIFNDPAYQGIKIYIASNGITVLDFTDPNFVAPDGVAPLPTTSNPIQLSYNDFIGQPSWIQPFIISIKMVMRADLKIGAVVSLPKNGTIPILSTHASNPFVRAGLTFTGICQVQTIRHVGAFRQPDANAWVTIAELIAIPSK